MSKVGGAFSFNLFYILGAALKAKISLRDWIDQTGVSVIAEKLGVVESTVRHWRRGHCLPTAEQMLAIKQLSKGQITTDNMIENHFKDNP